MDAEQQQRAAAVRVARGSIINSNSSSSINIKQCALVCLGGRKNYGVYKRVNSQQIDAQATAQCSAVLQIDVAGYIARFSGKKFEIRWVFYGTVAKYNE